MRQNAGCDCSCQTQENLEYSCSNLKDDVGGRLLPASRSFNNLKTIIRKTISRGNLNELETDISPAVVFFNVPWAGHAYPTYPLVAQMVQRGIKVHYFQNAAHKSLLKSIGAEFHPYVNESLDVPSCFSRKRELAKPLQMLPATLALLPFLLEAVKSIGPSLIMYEASVPWGWLVARLLQIPSACLCSMNVGNTLPAMNPLITEALLSDEATNEANVAIKEMYGVDIMAETEFYFHYSPHLNLVTTSKLLNPPMDRNKALKVRHETFHFVGPMIDKRCRPWVQAMDKFTLQARLKFARQANQKIIYVSFGTIVADDYWGMCRKAVLGTLSVLRDSLGVRKDCFVLVSTGSNKAAQKDIQGSLVARRGSPPSNFMLRPSVDQIKVLETADLFITHGGQNSLMEALICETACLVIPFFGDQPENASVIERCGCGTALEKDIWKSPALLSQVVNECLLSSKPREEALRKVSLALKNTGGVASAVDKILELIELSSDCDDIFSC